MIKTPQISPPLSLSLSCAHTHRGGIIKRRLKKIDPFKPREFARRAQEQFVEVNKALEMLVKIKLKDGHDDGDDAVFS